MDVNPIKDAIMGLVKPIADKFFPDAKDKEAFQLEMQKQLQSMDMAELDSSYKAIIAEASSTDKWTSRARPTFMYVFYCLIMASLPMAICYAISPATAAQITQGFKGWLEAIPNSFWDTFTVGFVGYSVSRSYDKHMERKFANKK